MDPLFIIAGLVVLAGAAAYVVAAGRATDAELFSPADTATTAKATKATTAKAKAAAEPSSTTPTTRVAEPSARVKALRSSEAVKTGAAPVAQIVPTKTALIKQTKANIIASAQQFNIQLNPNHTKEQLVQDYLSQARAQAKAATK
jgi:hypothetical protein